MKNVKRLLSLILCAVAVMHAQAETNLGFSVAGMQVNNQNCAILNDVLRWSNFLRSGNVSYNADTRTLTLDNAEIWYPAGQNGIVNDSCPDLTILVKGSCHLISSMFDQGYNSIDVHRTTHLAGTPSDTLYIVGALGPTTDGFMSLYYSENGDGDLFIEGLTLDLNVRESMRRIQGGGTIHINQATIIFRTGWMSGPQFNVYDFCEGWGFVYPIGAHFDEGNNFVDGEGNKISIPRYTPSGDHSIRAIIRSLDQPFRQYSIWAQKKQVNELNEGDVLGDGTVRYDPDTKTLTLSNATIQGSGTVTGLPEERGTGLYIGEPGVTVDVEGLNTITGAADCEALWFGNDAKNGAITGDGSLVLNSDYTSLHFTADTLTIGGNVTIQADCGVGGLYRYRAGHPNWYSTLCMKDNATVKAYRPGGPAIFYWKELLLEDGQTILEPEGAYWDAEEHEPRYADGSRIEGEWMVIANGNPKAVDLVFRTDSDNYGLIQENNGQLANVTIKGRTFRKDGTWQTICLPFDVELDGSPLEGADARQIGAAQEVEGCLVIDCLTPVTKLEAGCPYIIRWNSAGDIVDPVFSGVTIKATRPQPVFLFDNRMVFGGLYDFYQMDNNNESAATHTYYVGGNGVLHNFVGRSNAYAFECYFVVDPTLDEWPKPIALHTDGSIDELLKSLGIGQGPADLTFWPYGVNSDLIEGNEGRLANVTIEDCTFRKDGTWQTICLPFDVELDGSPLEGADARTAEAMQEVEGYLVIDCLTPVTKLEAGCPYIIRWNGGDDIVNPVFSGVTIKAIKPQPVFLSDNKWVFIGLYSFYPMEDDEHASLLYYLGGNGVFHNFAGGGEVYAFQCYLVANQTPDEWPESIVLHTDGSIEDLIDGIGDIKGQTATDGLIYNVAGQRLRKMQKGLNIVGNKKVLVK